MLLAYLRHATLICDAMARDPVVLARQSSLHHRLISLLPPGAKARLRDLHVPCRHLRRSSLSASQPRGRFGLVGLLLFPGRAGGFGGGGLGNLRQFLGGFVVLHCYAFRCAFDFEGFGLAGLDVIAADLGFEWWEGGFFVAAHADEDVVFAVDEGVVGDFGALDLEVAVGDGIGDAEHDAEGAAFVVSGEIFEAVGGDCVVFADEALPWRRVRVPETPLKVL